MRTGRRGEEGEGRRERGGGRGEEGERRRSVYLSAEGAWEAGVLE
jgi:hypothetical protein